MVENIYFFAEVTLELVGLDWLLWSIEERDRILFLVTVVCYFKGCRNFGMCSVMFSVCFSCSCFTRVDSWLIVHVCHRQLLL